MMMLFAVPLCLFGILILYLGFYFTRYDFSEKRVQRFDRLMSALYKKRTKQALYALIGGLGASMIFTGACLAYISFYRMLSGYPLVLLPYARVMIALLLCGIAVLFALLIGRQVLPMHIQIYLRRKDIQ